MAQDNDAEISTKFSTLNVNAMEFVPGVGFTSSTAASSSPSSLAAVNVVQQQQQQEQEMSNNSQPPPPNPDPVIQQPPTSLPINQDKVTDEFESLERRTMNGNGRRKFFFFDMCVYVYTHTLLPHTANVIHSISFTRRYIHTYTYIRTRSYLRVRFFVHSTTTRNVNE